MNRTLLIACVSIVAFALLPVSCATQTGRNEAAAIPGETPAQAVSPEQNERLIARGQEVFAATCVACHSVDGLSNKSGPDLADYGDHGFSQARVEDMLRDFQRYLPGSMMPTWDEAYPQEDIAAAAAYVRSLKRQAFYAPQEIGE